MSRRGNHSSSIGRCTRVGALAVLLSVAVVGLPACDGAARPAPPPLPRAPRVEIELCFFHSESDDGAERLVSAGVLSLPEDFAARSFLTGTWRLGRSGAANVVDARRPAFIAPLFGPGDFTAERSGDDWLVNLHPGVIDDNVELILPADLGGAGSWQYVTDAGVTRAGAVRLQVQLQANLQDPTP